MSERPPFDLESYEDTSLKHFEELHDTDELLGHTIKAVITDPAGEYCDGTELVIVTETGCWVVIEAESSYCHDEAPSVQIRSKPWNNEKRSLSDFLSAADMRLAGLCTDSDYELLKKSEIERKQRKDTARAEVLRKQLAELEGGAA